MDVILLNLRDDGIITVINGVTHHDLTLNQVITKIKEINKKYQNKKRKIICPYCKGHSAKHPSTCEDCCGTGYIEK
jgi:DnaJ-class molecular chaperone